MTDNTTTTPLNPHIAPVTASTHGKINDLRALAADIAKNPGSVNDLDLEAAASLRRELDPLGNIISNKDESKKTYINIGLVNWRDRYLRKLHMTTLVGFVYRMLEEYEPEAELAKELANHERAMAKTTNDDARANLRLTHEARCKLITKTSHDIIEQFLNRNFEYNPDKHLRGAHIEGREKPDLNVMINKAAVVEDALEKRPETTYKYMRGNLLACYQHAQEIAAAVATVVELLNDPNTSTEDQQGILIKKYVQLTETLKDMSTLVEPLIAADTVHAWAVNPPAEGFHQIDRYLTNHYEQLRACTQTLYSERADIEFGVVVHGVHRSAEEASNYRVQHREEFRTDVIAVESGAVTLVGPFKENRDALEYYNKNTEVLRLMHSQLEADHKLGEDLMKKKAKTEKKKNIDLAGPDEPGIKEYAKTMNAVRELGGKKMLTREEQDALVEAKAKAAAIKQDYEVPDGYIQVDVFSPQPDGTLAKGEFFTEAEKPLHMEDNSPYMNSYQPAGSKLDGSS